MKASESKKLDQIITMLGDMVDTFGKRFDKMDNTLEQHGNVLGEHTEILNDHTRRLNTIESDVKTNLDKRLQLEVRTGRIEKHLGLDKNIAASA